MESHILLKFRHWQTGHGNAHSKVTTINAHIEMIKKKGKTWWGTGNTSISQEKAGEILAQVSAGIPTYAFLYEMGVPKNIHTDSNIWYVAKILGVSVGMPADATYIPGYYDKSCATYFLITDIQQIKFKEGTTPKVPGQACIRHVGIIGAATPENLVSLNNTKQGICVSRQQSPDLEYTALEHQDELHKMNRVTSEDKLHERDLALRVIELQDELIELKDEVKSLLSYKEYYNKIITADYLFSSEKFFETWIQDNFHKIIPECEIMDRQPLASWPDGKFGRLDLLAINKETSELVIIEVKTRKRSKSSGYDQFIRYVSWARRNKEMLSKKYIYFKLAPTDSPEFVIITDYADDEMKAICRDQGIRLILVLGGLSFERAA